MITNFFDVQLGLLAKVRHTAFLFSDCLLCHQLAGIVWDLLYVNFTVRMRNKCHLSKASWCGVKDQGNSIARAEVTVLRWFVIKSHIKESCLHKVSTDMTSVTFSNTSVLTALQNGLFHLGVYIHTFHGSDYLSLSGEFTV